MSHKSHIGIDLRMYKMSGIGRYLQLLIPAILPRIHAAKITLLGNMKDFEGETWAADKRIAVREICAPIFSVSEQLENLRGTYRDIDILWAPQYNIPLLYRRKLLVTIHDVCQLAHPETLGSDLQRWYARHLFRAVRSRAEAILCVSEFTASEVQKYLEIDRSRLIVTYPPVGTWINSSPPPVNLENCRYFLTVGNIKKHKNLKLLIAAFETICRDIPHRLIVVGKQNRFRNAEDEFSSASTMLDGRVHFTGHISDQELSRYYQNAEALIFPSFYEGFGLPVIEAMAQGCPVACSNVSALPEVGGDAVLLFNPFDINDIAKVLIMLASDAALRRELIQRGLKRARLFQTDASAEKTATVINRIIGSAA